MRSYPRTCPFEWCPIADVPLSRAEFLAHHEDVHLPPGGSHSFPDRNAWAERLKWRANGVDSTADPQPVATDGGERRDA